MERKEMRKIIIKEGSTLETRIYEVLKPNGDDWNKHGKKYGIEGLLCLIKGNNGVKYFMDNIIKEDLRRYEEMKRKRKEYYLKNRKYLK